MESLNILSIIYLFILVYCMITLTVNYEQEIGVESSEEMTQRIQELQNMYDMLNEQVFNSRGIQLIMFCIFSRILACFVFALIFSYYF